LWFGLSPKTTYCGSLSQGNTHLGVFIK
jgi:hypothetical protein